ncbi:hypothetical protein RAB70_04685 [Xanthomonas sontii]|uniref:hypothetical protein n=1 Tax=Xanthomonas sontii TaxID=2650745 RepID=UPI0027FE9B3F|nr:hypothetical protein [Xanthomonas sontii]MDQ7757932.1 hypothetical protein [Xanthomonas sontii]
MADSTIRRCDPHILRGESERNVSRAVAVAVAVAVVVVVVAYRRSQRARRQPSRILAARLLAPLSHYALPMTPP